eukprot:12882719-Prorocentrum_lima.AAC.1
MDRTRPPPPKRGWLGLGATRPRPIQLSRPRPVATTTCARRSFGSTATKHATCGGKRASSSSRRATPTPSTRSRT